jgi:putative inorganic carbon (HCO3(-)) transporter
MKQAVQNESGASDVPKSVHSFRASALFRQLQYLGLVGITFSSFFPAFSHFQEYAFFFLLAVGLSISWIEKTNPLVRSPIDLPLLVFVGWVLCTLPFAIDPAYSFSEWRKLVAHVLVFYWAMFVLRQHGSVELPRQIIVAAVFGSLILSGLALEDFVLRGGTWKHRLIRAGAPNSDYNWLTTYLVLVIPVLIAWLLIHQTFRARALGVLAIMAAAIAQIAAYTRAGWLAHFAQAFGFVLMAGKRRVMVWVLIGAMAIGGGLIAISVIGYQRDTMDPWTFSARVKTWKLGFQQVIQHPIVGVGYGNDTFVRVYTAEIEADKDKGAEEKVLPALHNTFAMVLMGSGIPALVLFVWVFVRIVQELASCKVKLVFQRSSVLLFVPALALSVIGFVVRNAFDYMFAGSLASLFWILVASGMSIKNHEATAVSLGSTTVKTRF